MKSINKLFAVMALVCAGLAFSSCSSENKDDKDDLVGTWEWTSVKVGGMEISLSDLANFGMEVEEIITLTFNSDGTMNMKVVNKNGTVESSADGTYTRSGNTLTMVAYAGTPYEDTQTAEIVSLTANRLELLPPETMFEEMEGIEIIMVFTKR